MKEDESVYVPATGKRYATVEEFYAAESNGYVVVITSTRKGTVPAVFGPYPDKVEGTKARVRIRNRMVLDERQRYGREHKISSRLVLIWKDPS